MLTQQQQQQQQRYYANAITREKRKPLYFPKPKQLHSPRYVDDRTFAEVVSASRLPRFNAPDPNVPTEKTTPVVVVYSSFSSAREIGQEVGRSQG